uniref:Uncharacterized protein n=1 Tax=Hyaloperonospora arabidopsidis (strain Emoy2) TaxID=559515 RepID=M4BVP4_HYAAE
MDWGGGLERREKTYNKQWLSRWQGGEEPFGRPLKELTAKYGGTSAGVGHHDGQQAALMVKVEEQEVQRFNLPDPARLNFVPEDVPDRGEQLRLIDAALKRETSSGPSLKFMQSLSLALRQEQQQLYAEYAVEREALRAAADAHSQQQAEHHAAYARAHGQLQTEAEQPRQQCEALGVHAELRAQEDANMQARLRSEREGLSRRQEEQLQAARDKGQIISRHIHEVLEDREDQKPQDQHSVRKLEESKKHNAN